MYNIFLPEIFYDTKSCTKNTVLAYFNSKFSISHSLEKLSYACYRIKMSLSLDTLRSQTIKIYSMEKKNKENSSSLAVILPSSEKLVFGCSTSAKMNNVWMQNTFYYVLWCFNVCYKIWEDFCVVYNIICMTQRNMLFYVDISLHFYFFIAGNILSFACKIFSQ